MTEIDIRPRAFLIGWLVGGVLVYPISIVLLAALWGGLTIVFGSMMYRPSYGAMNFLGGVGVVLVSGAIIGFCVGAVQRILLRRYLLWTADHWRRYSLIGGSIGAGVAMLVYGAAHTIFQRRLGYNVSPEPAAMVIMPLFIGILSVIQWMSLRHAVRQALLWVMANVVGGLVFSGMLWINAPRMDENVAWIALVTGVLGQAFITGFVILWLFEKQAYPINDKEDVISPQGPRSLWDEAI